MEGSLRPAGLLGTASESSRSAALCRAAPLMANARPALWLGAWRRALRCLSSAGECGEERSLNLHLPYAQGWQWPGGGLSLSFPSFESSREAERIHFLQVGKCTRAHTCMLTAIRPHTHAHAQAHTVVVIYSNRKWLRQKVHSCEERGGEAFWKHFCPGWTRGLDELINPRPDAHHRLRGDVTEHQGKTRPAGWGHTAAVQVGLPASQVTAWGHLLGLGVGQQHGQQGGARIFWGWLGSPALLTVVSWAVPGLRFALVESQGRAQDPRDPECSSGFGPFEGALLPERGSDDKKGP